MGALNKLSARDLPTELNIVPFPLISDLSSYSAATFPFHWQKAERNASLECWIEVFRRSIIDFQKRAATDASIDKAESKAQTFAKSYEQILDRLSANPDAELSSLAGQNHGKLDCVLLCQLREQCLRAAGFRDVFASVKQQESEKALQLLPAVLSDLDADFLECDLDPPSASREVTENKEECLEQRWLKIIRGVFAGNIFDLGATASAKLFEEAGSSFLTTRNEMASRKCAIDDLSFVTKRLKQHPYRKALLFVDNAGSDVVLGMLPLARALLEKGTIVTMTANSVPSINDVTAKELQGILDSAATLDKTISRAMQEGILSVVESGNDLPVIDLSKVSKHLASASRGVDLVILEGMGRAIETNLHARLTCDKINLGMIKHPEVASLLQCQVYDCVCKFTPADSSL